jgi:hypothetical protein
VLPLAGIGSTNAEGIHCVVPQSILSLGTVGEFLTRCDPAISGHVLPAHAGVVLIRDCARPWNFNSCGRNQV